MLSKFYLTKKKNAFQIFFKILQSVIASLFGIQSKKNMETDFEEGKFVYYIITAIIVFIILLIVLHKIVTFIT